MIRILSLLAAILVLAAGAASPAQGAGPVSTERIEAELVPMSAWGVPGSTAVVAVRQVIAPGWHTYWRNPGDSGGATELDWTLPPGVEAGEILWPLPERQPIATLMNYGYSGEVFLPVPLAIPADAVVGSTLPLSVEALFLVCSDEMCIPQTLTLSLELPVRSGPPPLAPAWGDRIRQVVAAAPRPGGLQATIARVDGALRLSVAGEPLSGATAAYFFPFEGNVVSHPAPQGGERGPAGLTLTLAPGSATGAGLTGPVAGVLATDVGAWEIVARPDGPLPGTAGEGALVELDADGAGVSPGLFAQAMLFALIGGLILNLMPCVFPVLSMKAAALAGAAHDPRAARRDGLAFLVGVLTTFLLLAGLLIALRAGGQAIGWGFQLQSPAVIAGLTLVMLAVGLNLSGVYHMGSALQSVGGRLGGGKGTAGAFLTGALAVIVAAPCTAPFMAFAMGAALTFPAALALAVFAALGLGLALPFVILSFSPALLRRLPRPGPWMGRLKGLLAFPMYAVALWLAWVFSRQAGGDALALLFAAALVLALAAHLWGQAQGDRLAGGRAYAALVGAVLALLAAAALAVVASRSAQAPSPAERAAPNGLAAAAVWSPEALAAARAEARPVFVNFTADWCVTCKVNEQAALGGRRTAQAFADSRAVYMVADWTLRDDAIAAELSRHGRSGVPLYLVYPAGDGPPVVLPQLLTEGVVIEALAQAGRDQPGG